MLRDLVLVTPPAVELVSTAELKAHLRIEATDTDGLIEAHRATAMGHLDGYAGILGRALADQRWTLYLDRFPRVDWRTGRATLKLPLPPLLSVFSIAYVDTAGVSQTMASTDYTVLAGERAEVEPAYGLAWPVVRRQARAVAVTFNCGWTAPAAGVAWPAKLQPAIAAIKLLVGGLYDGAHPDNLISSVTIASLLRPLRIPRV